MPAKQSRRWSLTINNPSSDTVRLLHAVCVPYLPPDVSESASSQLDNLSPPPAVATTITVDNAKIKLWRDHVRFWISGAEVAPTTGTPHLQCYMETLARKTCNSMRSFLASLTITAHLTISDGTPSQNVVYCTKENTDLLTYGTVSTTSQATKKASEGVTALVHQGASMKRIAEEYPEYYQRCHRGIGALRAIIQAPPDHEEPRDFKTRVHVYIGPTGTGKSRRAHEEDKITWTHHGDRWFDGYQGQEAVLFDDFDGVKSGIPFRKFLQLTDRYPLSVPIKGGFSNWRPRVLVITTNVEPEYWYPEEDAAPLRRRLDLIVRFSTPFQ